MKQRVLALTLLAGLAGFAASAAHADKLDDIKQAGVVRIAVFDSNPPFGYIDPQSKKSWWVMMLISPKLSVKRWA